jgi:hypothetical protein
LKAKHIDYDGSVTGFVTTLVKIPEFKGTISLTELDAYPLDMHHDKDALVKKLVLRGKVFANLRVWTCLEHAGKAYTKDESGYGVETQVCAHPSRPPLISFLKSIRSMAEYWLIHWPTFNSTATKAYLCEPSMLHPRAPPHTSINRPSMVTYTNMALRHHLQHLLTSTSSTIAI